MEGQKHLIECHCVLNQFKNSKKTIYHKFVVFSIIDDSDVVIPSYAQCNNCGVVHKIIDICVSEILAGKDESAIVETLKDVCLSLPKHIVDLLNDYKLDLPDYQMSRFIIDNKRWNSHIILSSEISDSGLKTGKLLKFISEDKLRVEPFSMQVML